MLSNAGAIKPVAHGCLRVHKQARLHAHTPPPPTRTHTHADTHTDTRAHTRTQTHTHHSYSPTMAVKLVCLLFDLPRTHGGITPMARRVESIPRLVHAADPLLQEHGGGYRVPLPWGPTGPSPPGGLHVLPLLATAPGPLRLPPTCPSDHLLPAPPSICRRSTFHTKPLNDGGPG